MGVESGTVVVAVVVGVDGVVDVGIEVVGAVGGTDEDTGTVVLVVVVLVTVVGGTVVELVPGVEVVVGTDVVVVVDGGGLSSQAHAADTEADESPSTTSASVTFPGLSIVTESAGAPPLARSIGSDATVWPSSRTWSTVL